MTLAEFTASLADAGPPPALSPALVALWHDRRGNWEMAHSVAQDIKDRTGSLVHAYLHRKEGDDGNARYWYQKAGVSTASGSLDDEWSRIVAGLLDARLHTPT